MTGGKLISKLRDSLVELEDNGLWPTLTVPQLMHIKAEFDRVLIEAIQDPATPCKHEGTRWMHPGDGKDRCGRCNRVIEKEISA